MNYSSLSDFISRTEIAIDQTGKACIVIDYYQGDENKPVRLAYFNTAPELSDFEIWEEGWSYFNRLIEKIDNLYLQDEFY